MCPLISIVFSQPDNAPIAKNAKNAVKALIEDRSLITPDFVFKAVKSNDYSLNPHQLLFCQVLVYL